jgi:hypothetical protein
MTRSFPKPSRRAECGLRHSQPGRRDRGLFLPVQPGTYLERLLPPSAASALSTLPARPQVPARRCPPAGARSTRSALSTAEPVHGSNLVPLNQILGHLSYRRG